MELAEKPLRLRRKHCASATVSDSRLSERTARCLRSRGGDHTSISICVATPGIPVASCNLCRRTCGARTC